MPEGEYDFREPFNAKDWAMYHERVCATRWTSADLKLGWIIKIGGTAATVVMTVVIGLLSWSLKANYDAQQTAIQSIHQAASDSSNETVRKLGVTPSPSTPPAQGN